MAAKLRVPQSGSTSHSRAASSGPERPSSSPIIASSGRWAVTTARIAASEARSADVAKSVPCLAKRSTGCPYLARTSAAPADAAAMATSESITDLMQTTGASRKSGSQKGHSVWLASACAPRVGT